MFERYTEEARRIIFFARYEASTLHSGYIELPHLLLGLLREDKLLMSKMPSGAEQTIRREIEMLYSGTGSVSTTVDMPLDNDSKKALEVAADEADLRKHRNITPGHLVLALLRLGDPVAGFLQSQGIQYDTYGQVVNRSQEAGAGEPPTAATSFDPGPARDAQAPSLRAAVEDLRALEERAAGPLALFSPHEIEQKLKRKPWTRREALGHLVDSAATHQAWFARAVSEARLVAAGYPQDDWVTLQDYQSFDWDELVKLWSGLNHFLIHVLVRIPEDKVNAPCRIGLDPAVPLHKLVSAYAEHCEDLMAQILARL